MEEKSTCKPSTIRNNNDNVLKDYFILWLEKLEQSTEDKFKAMEAARILAAESVDIHFKNLNEWRDTVKDRNALYFTRPEHELYMKSVEADMRVLREARAEQTGMAKQSSVYIALVIAGIGIIISACGFGVAFATLLLHLMDVI